MPWNFLKKDTSIILPYNMTNLGLSVSLPLQSPDPLDQDYVVASLRCWGEDYRRIKIHLRRFQRNSQATAEQPIYRRTLCNEFEIASPTDDIGPHCDIYVLEDEQYAHIKLFDRISGRSIP